MHPKEVELYFERWQNNWMDNVWGRTLHSFFSNTSWNSEYCSRITIIMFVNFDDRLAYIINMDPISIACINALVSTNKDFCTFSFWLLSCCVFEEFSTIAWRCWILGLTRAKGKIRFQDFQFICKLNIFNEDKPTMTKLEGVLMKLNAIELWWFFITKSISIVSWLTSHEDKGWLLMILTRRGLELWTKEILWPWTKSWTRKQVEAPESNNS